MFGKMQKIRNRIISFVLIITMVLANNGMVAVASAISGNVEEGIYLNYLVVGSPYIETQDDQYVLADIGDGTLPIETATLTYINKTTGITYNTVVDTIDEGSLLFVMNFNENDGTGEYIVLSLAVVIDGRSYEINIEETGIEAKFGVNTTVTTEADAYTAEEDATDNIETDIKVIDETGEVESFDSFKDALDTVTAGTPMAASEELLGSTANPNLVVVLDPAHGGSESGATGHGLIEKDLNLKIARYCREKLQEYSHVEVYMTRDSDVYVSLADRTTFAQSKNADIFVSFHINAYNGAALGSEVYYPNGSYIPGIGTEGQELSAVVQAKLVALGLANRGIKIRNSENGSTYPDGSIRDYLSVVAGSKEKGFPGILIEHGFIDNASDVANFLSKEDKLKEMGVADALSIAEYYGLSKNGSYGTKPTIADTIRDAVSGSEDIALTPIMNAPTTAVDQMAAYFNSKATYPDYYLNTDAPDINTFCQMYYDEAVAEGVDPGVAFAQAMKETGFLKFGGQVNISQFNFAGLGATDNGASGAVFSSVREGIRAQIQHLKAYATESSVALANPCVDNRFQYVTRGCAPYVEYLGQNENPSGKGWATSLNYGYSIVNDYMSQFCNITHAGTSTSSLKVSYRTYLQTYRWQDWKSNGTEAGTTGLGKRVEAVQLKVSGDYDLGITYQTHVQSYGWLGWSSDGVTSGTSGEAKRMEAIRIKLTGSDADKFDVYYRVHTQTFGWLGWAKNGETSGTEGFSKRVEAMQVYVMPKGVSPANGTYAVSYIQYGKAANNADNTGIVNYMTHVQSFGNQSYVYDGSLSGTFGLAKRLEAIRINVDTGKLGVSGGITYRTHVQSKGWLDWVSDNALSGTVGQSKRMEAIEIKLTGDLEQKYDVYYRVHAQTYGWMGWAKNGEPAGTEGYGKRMEAIQIVLVPKGGQAPNTLPASNTMGAYAKK